MRDAAMRQARNIVSVAGAMEATPDRDRDPGQTNPAGYPLHIRSAARRVRFHHGETHRRRLSNENIFRPRASAHSTGREITIELRCSRSFSMSDRLNPGTRLTTDQSIISSDGRFRLSMQNDGNLVVYRTHD